MAHDRESIRMEFPVDVEDEEEQSPLERILMEFLVDFEEATRTGVPIGWHFRPTDLELMNFLINKVLYKSLPAKAITEIAAIDFFSKHPKDLVKSISNEPEHYFFIHDHGYFHGEINRKQNVGDGIGYWRCMGKEVPVRGSDGKLCAFKIHSTYFSAIPRPKKTYWRLEEYRLADIETSTEEQKLPIGDWVPARITGARDPRK